METNDAPKQPTITMSALTRMNRSKKEVYTNEDGSMVLDSYCSVSCYGIRYVRVCGNEGYLGCVVDVYSEKQGLQ